MRIHGVDILCAPLNLMLLFLSPNSYISENSESAFVVFYYFLRERECVFVLGNLVNFLGLEVYMKSF